SLQTSQEIRLSSDERLFGMLDYTIGGLLNRLEANTSLIIDTPLFLGPASPATYFSMNKTNLLITNRTLEKSFFGNVTLHFGDATELSGGVRRIHYNVISNLPGANGDFHAWVYSGTLKHRFSENLLAYVSTGSSWRVGVGTTGIILSSGGNIAY